VLYKSSKTKKPPTLMLAVLSLAPAYLAPDNDYCRRDVRWQSHSHSWAVAI